MKKIALTYGDINGIGVEILIKALNKLSLPSEDVLIVGSRKVFEYYAVNYNLSLNKNYEIIVLSKNQEKPKSLENINWQNVKLNKNEVLKGIRKSDYTKKDKKVIIYFDSNVADVGTLILKNPKIQTYRTNYVLNAKLIYD